MGLRERLLFDKVIEEEEEDRVPLFRFVISNFCCGTNVTKERRMQRREKKQRAREEGDVVFVALAGCVVGGRGSGC